MSRNTYLLPLFRCSFVETCFERNYFHKKHVTSIEKSNKKNRMKHQLSNTFQHFQPSVIKLRSLKRWKIMSKEKIWKTLFHELSSIVRKIIVIILSSPVQHLIMYKILYRVFVLHYPDLYRYYIVCKNLVHWKNS